jgi:hypothetical protein
MRTTKKRHLSLSVNEQSEAEGGTRPARESTSQPFEVHKEFFLIRFVNGLPKYLGCIKNQKCDLSRLRSSLDRKGKSCFLLRTVLLNGVD